MDNCWKDEIRVRLQKRDARQKEISSLVQNYSKLQARLALRGSLWEEIRAQHRPEGNQESVLKKWVEFLEEPIRLQLELRESRLAQEQLTRSLSELHSVLQLKDEAIQCCHSQLSRCRGDAVSLSRRASALEAGLCEREVELERLSVEHAALRLAHAELEAGLSRAERENSRLLQQIVEEKRGEAERMNEQNEIQERWCKLVMKLQRKLQSKPAQCCPLSV
ncbi:uncharacterized protein LOC117969368 [Acipenser ruthenus]|uniref:uncharacterized protein LOC117969368 n=1 Tax=Acipenser ruthenus TaxID=7906 RepID=UPI00155FC6DF|nr:uncharacterized protein LOC117969368 [Acipenser ruthenus]